MTWKVGDVHDDAVIMAILNRDRAWAAYAICDLDLPYRKHARYISASQGDVVEAVVLVYRLQDFAVLVPCGTTDGVRAVLEHVDDLPAMVSLQVRPADRATLESRYRSDDLVTMQRMVVSAGAARRSGSTPGIETIRLDPAQARQLLTFYERLPGRGPSAESLLASIEHGIYYGALDGGQLVAVAGTHAISDRFSTATVGGVFTAPEYRGRGLAQATTGAVLRALAERGIAEIALNVRADNVPAVTAYQRLGFRAHCAFWEGDAVLLSSRRTSTSPAT